MAAASSERAFDVLLRVASGDPAAVAWRVDRDLKILATSKPQHANIEGAAENLPLEQFFETGNSASEIVGAHRQALEGETRLINFFWLGQPYRAHIAPDYDPDERIQGALGLAFPLPDHQAHPTNALPHDRYFQSLIRQSPVGFFLTDAEGHCTFVNPSWCEMTGLSCEEAAGNGWLRGIHPDDRETVKQFWYETAQNQGRWQLEYRWQRADGRTTWVYSQAISLSNEEGHFAGYLGINVDITHLKQTEEELRSSESKYRQLLSAMTAYRYTVDVRDGQPIRTQHSSGCQATTGYTPEDYAADPDLWIKMIHPDDHQRVLAHVEQVHSHDAVGPVEHRIIHRDGSVRWVRDTIVRHVDHAGVLARYDGLIEDITDRKRADMRLRRVVESAPDAMVIADQQGRIILASKQTSVIFGYTRDELIGQTVEMLLPKRFRGQHIHNRKEYARHPETKHMSDRPTLIGMRTDGTEFPAEVNLSPIETEEGILVSAAIRDVTQRQRLERKLTSTIQTQSTLVSLLKLSLEPISLEEHLGRTLDVLLAIPWIELESKGAILLVEGEPPRLVMKAHRGLSGELLNRCDEVPIGECLCGRAADLREIVFASSIDDNHTRQFDDMHNHGHYCVPILFESQLLGVLNLYVREGHKQTAQEEDFLNAVANLLAGVINRRTALRLLRQSEERFDLAVSGSDAGIWDWDIKTGKVYFSPRWKSILGYADHEIENDFSEWASRLHPDDRERALQTVDDYLKGLSADYELEHRLKHKDGSYIWILARGAAVRNEKGQPHRMAGSHIDITSRKKSEQLLRERDAQLLAAQRIQEKLLPRDEPNVPGFDIAGTVVPAEFAAGDYFDYLTMRNDAIGVVIGDVSGHGFSSALLTFSTCAHLRSFVVDHDDIEEILQHTNSALCRETDDGLFETLLFAKLQPATRTLEYVNAGHPAGLVIDKNGKLKHSLKSSTIPLGILSDADFHVAKPIQLEVGDAVVFVTDGILETRSSDGSFFNVEHVLDTVRDHLHQSARGIVEAVQNSVREFAHRHQLRDDVTIVVVKSVPNEADGGKETR
jgi:PAS domain S-box-containing protein